MSLEKGSYETLSKKEKKKEIMKYKLLRLV